MKSTPDEPVEYLESTLEEVRMPPLSITADVVQLLEHFGDEAKTFEFLGKLKDLFG